MTDHSEAIKKLRVPKRTEIDHLMDAVLADLLELHDRTSLSLDNWDSAKRLIKLRTDNDVQKNGV